MQVRRQVNYATVWLSISIGRQRTKGWAVEGDDAAAALACERPHYVAPGEDTTAIAMDKHHTGVGTPLARLRQNNTAC